MNEAFKPTIAKPMSSQSKAFEKNFSKTMIQNNQKLNEVDGLLSEVEQSLKKKIFSLSKMEALVFSDPKLSAVYEEMAENGEEKYGYHYNETIQNMIFNDYVLNSPRYLQKYKMAIPKEKKRRDKSGINQLKKAGEVKMTQSGLPKQKKEVDESNEPLTKVMFLVNEKDSENPDVFAYFPEENHDREGKFKTGYSHVGQHSSVHPEYAAESRPASPEEYQALQAELEGLGYNLEVIEKSVNESSTAGSAGGAAGYTGYATPSAWGSGELAQAKGKSNVMKKPIWQGGTFIQESQYLTDPSGFAKYVESLNENDDIDFIQKNSEAYGSLDNMNKDNLNIIKSDIKTGELDEASINEIFTDAIIGDDVVDIKPQQGENPFTINGKKYQYELAKYANGHFDNVVYSFSDDVYYDYRKWRKLMGIDENNIKEETQTMIQNNGTSMSNKPQAMGDQSGNVPMGMQQTGGMNESDMNLLEELNNELNAFSIHHDKLKKMTEDRKPSSLVLKDRMGAENKANFKKDLQHSGTKEIIDVEKELQWKDQQTDVNKDPQKAGLDIEKASETEAFENVGDSTNQNGKEIPKRNLTTEEQDEVNTYRNGMHSLVYDGKPNKRFEDRMKIDMGDDVTKIREKQLAARSNAPMYKKDTQPTQKGDVKTQFSESMITGRYHDALDKRRLIDFTLNEVKNIITVTDKMYELDFTGLGNTYNGKSVDNKVSVNETVKNAIATHKYYTDGKIVFAMKNPTQKLNESVDNNKPVVNEQVDKMKHLLGYKPESYTDTKKTKTNRGF